MSGVRRKAKRITNDPDGEANLPVRKTKELAENYERTKTVVKNNIPEFLRSNEDEKALFEHVLKGMAMPDSDNEIQT